MAKGGLVITVERYLPKYKTGLSTAPDWAEFVNWLQRVPRWKLWMATERGRWNHSATGWFASGYILPRDVTSELFNVDCGTPVHIVVLYREHVASDRPVRLYAKDIVDLTPPPERSRIVQHYTSEELLKSARGAEHSVVDQIESILAASGIRTYLDKAVDSDGDATVAEMLQVAGDVREGKGQNPDGYPALIISRDCVKVSMALPQARSSHDPVLRPKESAHHVLDVPGSEAQACLAMLRYGVSGFLSGEPGLLREEELACIRESFLNRPKPPGAANAVDARATAWNMHMKFLEAQQGNEKYIRRAMRGR